MTIEATPRRGAFGAPATNRSARRGIFALALLTSASRLFGQHMLPLSSPLHDCHDEECQCVSRSDRERIELEIADYIRLRGETVPLMGQNACSPTLPKYPFYPAGGTLWQDLFITNFNDLNLAAQPPGGVLDFMCTAWAYDGHDATDTIIRSFAEQAIGVPVFAARDGVVIAAHDGEFDMNTSWAGQPANYVTIDHGDGRIANYYHFKKNSVLVQPGDHVVAGQQLALVGSSGNSTWPHLHFASYQDGARFEPFAGPCNPIESGWYQQPVVPQDTYLLEFAFSRTNLDPLPKLPFDMPRTGTFAFGDTVRQMWFQVALLPANASIQFKLIRPNGTLATTGVWNIGNATSYRWSWWWTGLPFHPDLNTVAGTWNVEVSINGALEASLPFQVVPTFDPNANFPPEPIGAHFAPAVPRRDEVIFCEVDASLLVDDKDYDVVFYDYVWRVNQQVVRSVTSAGRADALSRTFATPGATITCEVTPKDGIANGAKVTKTVVVSAATLDCNDNGIDDAVEIAAGHTPDANGNGVPDICETTVIYVDVAASGLNSGTSWEDAFTSLDDALLAAWHRASDGLIEVWVADGVYVPDAVCGDRTSSFGLASNVAILGGFDGGESQASQRDPSLHHAILSGDRNGDDGANFANRTDNALHVIRCGAADATAVLDGFVITGGYANGQGFEPTRGAGAWIEVGSPTIRSCTFIDNYCSEYGAGVHAQSGADPLFEDCTFEANVARVGGGAVQTYFCGLTVKDSVIRGNATVESYGEGAGIRSHGGTCSIIGCTVEDNTASHAAALKHVAGTLVLTDSAIVGNTAANGGGALASNGPVEATNVLFETNSSTAWDAGAVWLFSNAPSTFTDCTFRGNSSFYNGGGLQSDAKLALVDCEFEGNHSGTSGAAMRLLASDVESVIRGCSFEGNDAGSNGGAIAVYSQPHLHIVGCSFDGNSSTRGGAIYLASAVDVLDQCVLTNNAADFGGGIYLQDTTTVVTNCTIAQNEAGLGAGMRINGAVGPTLTNSIVWGNSGSANIVTAGPGVVSYCVVGGGFAGTNNLSADPLFVDASTGDFRLAAGSPAIDSGNTSAIAIDVVDIDEDGDVGEWAPLDAAGNPRRFDDPSTVDTGVGPAPILDRGAFEFAPVVAPTADLNGDGVVGQADLAILLGSWGGTGIGDLDADGLVGPSDLAQLLGAWGTAG